MRFIYLFCFLFICVNLGAQEARSVEPIICRTDGTTIADNGPATYGIRKKSLPQSTFKLNFSDNVPSNARASIRFAADVWAEYLRSDVPISVSIDWVDQNDDRQLANAAPNQIVRSFPNAIDREVWYPLALGNSIAGFHVLNDPSIEDINIVVNSTANWNFDLTGTVPRDRIDLSTVILHELGHGLGFFSSIDTTDATTASIGFANDNGSTFPIIYDLFLATPDGRSISDREIFMSPSPEILNAVVDRLKFSGDNAIRENNGEPVPLFAPPTFDIGSSVSHTDERTYRAGTSNALMTPSIANGERIREPGPLNLAILEDLGWTVIFDPTPVRELVAGQLRPYPNPANNHFTLPLDDIVSPSVIVLYSADGREVRRQKISGFSESVPVNISGLPAGLYSLYLPDGERAFTGRVLVK